MNREARRGEQGFTLAALLVTLTILAVVIAYTVPVTWSDVLRRERDRQTIFAMRQYARAIAEFQRKTGVAPTSLAQLKEQKSPRILRNEYPDPLTGKVDWILIPPNGAPPVPVGPPPKNKHGRNRLTIITDAASSSYVGPFTGVRPPVQGNSFISLRGIDRYELWSFTTIDLLTEANGGVLPPTGMPPGGGPGSTPGFGMPPGGGPGSTPPKH
ncbi:MAG TPA: type II secretion system protein [Thermoanaerobaculia bacterium]|nr:type II secretion system protein [Thermoanaerobaculia bacterium]